MNISVNGENKTIAMTSRLSYSDLVFLAKGPGSHDKVWTVTYTKAAEEKTDGILVVGEFVKIKDGMVVEVYDAADSGSA